MRFEWDVFLQAGDPQSTNPLNRGNVKGGLAFAQPDGLYFDARGVLWIQTDSSAQLMATQGLGEHRQQPDAGRRPADRRGAPLPRRAGGLRDHRRRSSRPTNGPCSSTSSTPARLRCLIPGATTRRIRRASARGRTGTRADARAPRRSRSAAVTAASSGPDSAAIRRRLSRPDRHPTTLDDGRSRPSCPELAALLNSTCNVVNSTEPRAGDAQAQGAGG